MLYQASSLAWIEILEHETALDEIMTCTNEEVDTPRSHRFFRTSHATIQILSTVPTSSMNDACIACTRICKSTAQADVLLMPEGSYEELPSAIVHGLEH